MNIASMLVRLQGALGIQHLANRMVLIPAPATPTAAPHPLNFLVAYNGSAKSQTALDITLWIAYQTRVATSRQVTVHVVYVVDEAFQAAAAIAPAQSPRPQFTPASATATIAPAAPVHAALAKADRILWEARSLANDWRGSLETHLRVGQLATELRQIAQIEQASLLMLGCDTSTNPIVNALKPNVPCPVLGIPTELLDTAAAMVPTATVS